MKIYTRTGDKGETSLFTGARLSKSSPFFEALGAVDECNSTIGIALSQLKPDSENLKRAHHQLWVIQNALFDLGAAIATPSSTASEKKRLRTRFDDQGTLQLEEWIDAMEVDLKPLHTFILPGGHLAAATLHQARTICRRAERAVLALTHLHEVDPTVLIYLNRLSDYLFVVARYVNAQMCCEETLWQLHEVQKLERT